LLNEVIELLGLARVLLLATDEDIDLAATRRERAQAAADAEQQQLSDVAEVKTDAAAIRTAILADIVPDQVRLVAEPEGPKHGQSLGQKGVGTPQVQMGPRQRQRPDGQGGQLHDAQGRIAMQAAMLGSDLAGAVGETPGRVDQDGAEPPF